MRRAHSQTTSQKHKQHLLLLELRQQFLLHHCTMTILKKLIKALWCGYPTITNVTTTRLASTTNHPKKHTDELTTAAFVRHSLRHKLAKPDLNIKFRHKRTEQKPYLCTRFEKPRWNDTARRQVSCRWNTHLSGSRLCQQLQVDYLRTSNLLGSSHACVE